MLMRLPAENGVRMRVEIRREEESGFRTRPEALDRERGAMAWLRLFATGAIGVKRAKDNAAVA